MLARAIVTMLLISLMAVSAVAQTKAQCIALEHARGAWKMEIHCDQGNGAIVLIDRDGAKMYRGEGVFSNWSQQQMDEMYQSLIPEDTEKTELLQLG